MADKKDFQQVSDYVWELPRTHDPRMQVPARIYGNAEIFDLAFRDNSVQQLVNVAMLPGIVNYALAMPDMHQGYGFPIGGVAAFRADSGLISPGGVGYDINCLAGESRILHTDGYTISIAEMETEWEAARLRCQDLDALQESETVIVGYLRRIPATPVLRLVTTGGDELIATADHPVWTPNGMRPLGSLSPGDQVARYPFEGVAYEPPPDRVIVDEADVDRMLAALGKGEAGRATGQIKEQLRRLNLLPLRLNSAALPALLRLMGYVWGDGSLSFAGKSHKGVTWFYGDPADLEAMRQDVMRLGFTPSRVYSRRREHKITTTYDTYQFSRTETSFKVVGSAFAVLLAALGVPRGVKTTQDFRLPEWLFAAPRWQQRLFLAAFFGAKLSLPETITGHGANFYAPVLSMNKREGYVASGRAFLEDLSRLLAGFGVETKTISERPEQLNRDGQRSIRLRLVLSGQPQSLLNLWSRVGFEYHQRRRVTALVAVQYLREKMSRLKIREAVAETAVALQAVGVAPAQIYNELVTETTNHRFVERSLYGGRKTVVRVGMDFQAFADYRVAATSGLGESGMVWTTVAALEPVSDFAGEVYDFTVAHPGHNFVTDGFVVSNCGVRMLASPLHHEELRPHLEQLTAAIYRACPSGLGDEGAVRVTQKELDQVLERGAEWALAKGYATRDDLDRTEDRGAIAGADADLVPPRAKERGRPQLGSLGSGNHFLEIDVIDEIYEPEIAQAFGLFKDGIAVQIHCGSRGLGHEVCTQYLRQLQDAPRRYGIEIPDRELVAAPVTSPEGKAYLAAMTAAANYAFANRQILAHFIRLAFEQVLAGKVSQWELQQVYDVAHNIAKLEKHRADGQELKLVVHRKGATRAFPAGHPVLPPAYRGTGQPVLVPGSMGTTSYVLVGTERALQETFGSTCHGAGRMMSRSKALKSRRGEEVRDDLHEQGIVVRTGSLKGLAEEAPEAYKDVSLVVESVVGAGLARLVARVRPLAVIKG